MVGVAVNTVWDHTLWTWTG